jgi:nicotinamide-nucleotide amidase
MTDAEIGALAARLGARLAGSGATCATAESCTGGLVAGAITDVPGSSAWFERGFVTYSNEAKVELLGVPEATLAQHGAVSEATARAMAEGALARSRAGLAVAITGIAGPGGGSAAKPVGTVCFAWAVRGDATIATTRRFDGDRFAVRRAAVAAALAGLLAAVATLPAAARGPAATGSSPP